VRAAAGGTWSIRAGCVSRLVEPLASGRPVLTAQLPPVNTVDNGAVRAAVEEYAPRVDALNVVDNFRRARTAHRLLSRRRRRSSSAPTGR
jgi:hypothetical protein